MKIDKTQIARNLRKEQTPAESVLWNVLRNRKFQDLKFRRQHPLKDYIVDFYCDELELVIELDGGYHNNKEQKTKDIDRDNHLKFLGYRILRYPNEKVFEGLDGIYNDIITTKEQREEHFKKNRTNKKNNEITPSPKGEGWGEGLILSTKKLKLNQRDLLLGVGLSVLDYDAIGIEFLNFEMPSTVEYAIFTSQNGVKAFLNTAKDLPLLEERAGVRCFCVGQKTKALLEKNGLKVTKMVDNSAELGEFLVKTHKNDSLHYFCGLQRRDELPSILKSNGIEISEVKTYKTILIPKKFEQKWDGILFFSPSGVESYISENSISKNETTVICIGATTAAEASRYFENVVVANSTSVESVIAKAVKILNK